MGGELRAAMELSSRFHHVTCLDAGGADGHLFNAAVFQGTNVLKVGVEATLVNVVGVAYVVSDHRLFAAYFTHLGHVAHSFSHIDGFVKRPVGRICNRQDTKGLPALFMDFVTH